LAPFTRHVIPCGGLQEVQEVVSTINNPDAEWFVINLRGHGCIVASKDVGFFNNIKYMARPIPEMVETI
jgi:hypothetical protein